MDGGGDRSGREVSAAAPQPLSSRELWLIAGLLSALAAALYGPHVLHGGFALDDWWHADQVAHSSDLLGEYWAYTSDRPVLVAYMPALHALLGPNPWAHHLWSAILAVTMSTLLFAVLRRFGMARFHAAAIAVLVQLFPWSDSTRLWATASHITLAIDLGLAGLLLTLRGLELAGRRGIRYRAGGVLLYALSVLTYEIAAVVLLAVGALYLARAPARTALRLWGANVVVISACLAWVSANTRRERLSPSEALDHAGAMGDSALSLLARAAIPLDIDRGPVLAILAVVAIASLLATVGPIDPIARATLRRWLAVAGLGIAVSLAGWALFVPAAVQYDPARPGIGNRVNGVSAIGVVLVVYAAVVLAATLAALLSRPVGRGTALGSRVTALSSTVAIAIGLGYADGLRADQRSWARAADGVDHVLASVERGVPAPNPHDTIYTFNFPGWEKTEVPIFSTPLDLPGALRLMYDDATLAAGPVVDRVSAFRCERRRMVLAGAFWLRSGTVSRYGKAVLVDAETGAWHRVRSAAECREALRTLPPGPFLREGP